jgi:hypothetical protein
MDERVDAPLWPVDDEEKKSEGDGGGGQIRGWDRGRAMISFIAINRGLGGILA